MVGQTPLFTLRPVFIGWITFVAQLPFQLFFTAWAGGFVGGIVTTVFHVCSLNSYVFGEDIIVGCQPWVPFVASGAVAFFGIFAVTYFGKMLNYKRTEYRFFADRLEFDEGFLTIQKKVIRFRDVKEVTLRQGILQRTQGLGTLYLATFATGAVQANNPFVVLGFGNVSSSGIFVRDIQTPEDVFETVRKIVDAEDEDRPL